MHNELCPVLLLVLCQLPRTDQVGFALAFRSSRQVTRTALQKRISANVNRQSDILRPHCDSASVACKSTAVSHELLQIAVIVRGFGGDSSMQSSAGLTILQCHGNSNTGSAIAVVRY